MKKNTNSIQGSLYLKIQILGKHFGEKNCRYIKIYIRVSNIISDFRSLCDDLFNYIERICLFIISGTLVHRFALSPFFYPRSLSCSPFKDGSRTDCARARNNSDIRFGRTLTRKSDNWSWRSSARRTRRIWSDSLARLFPFYWHCTAATDSTDPPWLRIDVSCDSSGARAKRRFERKGAFAWRAPATIPRCHVLRVRFGTTVTFRVIWPTLRENWRAVIGVDFFSPCDSRSY